MRFGIHIGHMGGPFEEMRRLWRFADERGFDWFSVSDHFQESPPQGGGLDCFEGVTAMAVAAAETRRVRIGSLVYCINYRNPGVLAAALTTIDHISRGRLECGIGAGWHAAEHEAFGIGFEPIGVREDRLEEYAQVLRLLFDPTLKAAEFHGRFYRLTDARNNPKPLQQRVRIWIGGGGEKRTLRAVARYADGWNLPYQGAEVWTAKNGILDEWCAKEKRDPATILRTVNVGFYLGADARGVDRAEALYRTHWANDPRTGFLRGTPQRALETVGRYVQAGCQQLNIAFRQGPYDWDALEGFAETVLPAFSSRP